MKVATWNVNSVRARLDRLLGWLERHQPDIVCLQELKTRDDAFPFEPIEAAGYRALVYGQPTYNGVAILSRAEPTAIIRGLDDGIEDPQSRFLAAQIEGIHVLSAYVPNGQMVGSEPYAYKLRWLGRLRCFLDRYYNPAMPLVLCGDFNVARDERDVANPTEWAPSVLCHSASREALDEVLSWGLADVLRAKHPEGGVYSWWDYRNLGFPKNDGLRIDYLFATQPLANLCTSAEIDRPERKGVKPSDHAPVIAVFDSPSAAGCPSGE